VPNDGALRRFGEKLVDEPAMRSKLVLNDAGPLVSRAALERIASYVGKTPVFGSLDEAEKYVRGISTSFGPHSEAQWRFFTETWVRQDAEGKWRPHYDPRIAEAYRGAFSDKDLDLWYLYEAVRCPTLVLRGAESDLLSRDTAAQMARRGPKAKVVEIPGVGHAPTLLNPDQIGIVRDFLLEGETS